ncbi:hypothetical protein [Brevibacillus sp. SYSU BS000544]|uniref:hypothetical protein n=1 Tax=Brevibacillus sp. SYSU BS000544 TaxID=3416443 RepID=UPI003CE55737
MILDDYIHRFLSEREPLMIHLAVADERMRPFSVRAFGKRVDRGTSTLRVYILSSQASRFFSAARCGTGIITGLFTDGRTNESYQCKGSLIECGPCKDDEEDHADLQRYREGSMRIFPKLYKQFPLSTSVCSFVSYRVEEIYIQTPGPNAGRLYGRGG